MMLLLLAINRNRDCARVQRSAPSKNEKEMIMNAIVKRVPFLFHFDCSETWEKVNIVHNPNGTITFQQKKTFIFSEKDSNGSEDDVVIVPNIPMLSATSQSKHAAR